MKTKTSGPRKNTGKNQTPIMGPFILFSATLFLIILITGGAAFMFSMRQIIRTNKGVELSQLLEIERIKMETSVTAEIAIVREPSVRCVPLCLCEIFFGN